MQALMQAQKEFFGKEISSVFMNPTPSSDKINDKIAL